MGERDERARLRYRDCMLLYSGGSTKISTSRNVEFEFGFLHDASFYCE